MTDDAAFTAKDLDGEVLQCFWDMAEVDEGRRLSAAHKLIERVTTSSDPSSTASPQLRDYVVKRLVKGTGSGRMAARQGFATAFTAYLAAQSTVSFASVVELMDAHLAYSGSMKASEVKDLLLGRLFVYGALVKAGLVRGLADAERLVAGVHAIGTQRSFMSEAVVTLICELCDCLDPSVRQELLRSSPEFAAVLFVPPGEATAEALLLAVRLWPHMPPDVAAKCSLLPRSSPAPSSTVYSHPATYADADAAAAAAFFCSSHLAAVAEPLKASSGSHPRLHDVWRHLLALLLPGFSVAAPDPEGDDCQRDCRRPGAGQIAALWTSVVEQHLMVSSHERKALGLQLFCILLPHLSASDVPQVFSPNFLRCIANSLRDKGSYLHKSAQKCLDRLVGWARKRHDSDGPESTDVRLAALLALAQYSKVGFDGISKSKAVARLQAALDIEAVRRHHDQLKEAFFEGRLPSEPDAEALEAEGAAALAESSRLWVLAQLCGLLKVPACDEALAMDVLKFLAMVGFFDVLPAASKSKSADVRAFAACRSPISASVRTVAASRLAALATEVLPCLAPAKVSGQASQDSEPANGKDGAALATEPAGDRSHDNHAGRSGRALLTEVVAFIRKTNSLPAKHVRLCRGGDGAREARQQLAGMLASCSEAAASKRTGAAPLLHLLELVELMLCGDESESMQSLVTDLQPVVDAALALDTRDADAGDDEDAAASDPDGQPASWVNQLTECLLSLLADSGGCVPVAVVRSSAEAVWRAFCGEMNALALNDMLQVILRIDKQGAGDDMFEDEDGDEEAAASDEEGSADDEDDGDEDSDMDDGDEAPASSPAGGGEGSGDESDDAMDDEAMFRIDGKLAEYFKSIRGGKQDAKAQAEALRNFQMRVLSLLEIWMKKHSDSDLLPLSVLPLLRALRAALRPSGYAPLANRLKAVLVQRLAASRPALNADLSLPVLDSSDPVPLEGIMSKVMYLAAREKHADVRVAATKCYVMLLRSVSTAARAGGDGACEGLSQQLGALVVEVFDKKKSHWGVSSTVTDVLKHCNVAGQLLPALLDKASSARSEFLRTEALQACAAALRIAASDDAVHAAARAHGAALVKILAAVASGGYSKPARWADALKHGAGCLESLHAMGGGVVWPGCLGDDGVKQLRAAVGHGLSMDALPIKCQTQLQRWKRVLDGTKGPRGSTAAADAERPGADTGSAPSAKPRALGKRKANTAATREPKKSKSRSKGAAESD